jgi:hypothetical protein
MTESKDALAATLQRMEANERSFRLGLYGAALLESGFLAAFLLLADLKDRTQVLMLLNFAGLLSIVALAAVALATSISRHTLRVLRRVELLRVEAGR